MIVYAKYFPPITVLPEHFLNAQQRLLNQESPAVSKSKAIYTNACINREVHSWLAEYQGQIEYQQDNLPVENGTYIVKLKEYTVKVIAIVQDGTIVNKTQLTASLDEYLSPFVHQMTRSFSFLISNELTRAYFQANDYQVLLRDVLIKNAFFDCLSKGGCQIGPEVNLPSDQDIAATWQLGEAEEWSLEMMYGANQIEIKKTDTTYCVSNYNDRGGIEAQFDNCTLEQARSKALQEVFDITNYNPYTSLNQLWIK